MRLTSVRTVTLTILAATLLPLSGTAETPVKSVEEVRLLEKTVKSVVAKALPATVSLYSQRQGSSGSGVIVSKEGLILTAGHVVQGMEEVTVVFPDGEEVQGKVLGANFGRDAAMVKLAEPGPWPFVEVGDSKDLAVGDFVVSLGHAGGYDAVRTPPVRFGRVVGKDRKGFVSTDCTLIGGDSGGPLFDLEGRVIGIHSSIGASLMSNNHTGVANFKDDWDRLLKGDTWGVLAINPLVDPERPVIGFNVGGTVRQGVLVGEVVPDSPASLSGLRPGDVVTRINSKRVRNFRGLLNTLSDYDPGDEITVSVLRGGQAQDHTLRLARLGDVYER